MKCLFNGHGLRGGKETQGTALTWNPYPSIFEKENQNNDVDVFHSWDHVNPKELQNEENALRLLHHTTHRFFPHSLEWKRYLGQWKRFLVTSRETLLRYSGWTLSSIHSHHASHRRSTRKNTMLEVKMFQSNNIRNNVLINNASKTLRLHRGLGFRSFSFLLQISLWKSQRILTIFQENYFVLFFFI